jgi:hypothetical protein
MFRSLPKHFRNADRISIPPPKDSIPLPKSLGHPLTNSSESTFSFARREKVWRIMPLIDLVWEKIVSAKYYSQIYGFSANDCNSCADKLKTARNNGLLL